MKITIKNPLAILPDKTKKCDIHIDGDRICGIGSPPEGFVADKLIDGENHLITPGFVNAHTHIYMTALRNRADDLNFMTWLFDTVMPMENTLTEEDGYWSVLLGCMEMLLSGVTSILDMDIFSDATAKALADCGLRGVVCRGMQDISGWDGGLERIEIFKREREKYADVPTLNFFLAPHAPYTCGENYLRLIAETAAELETGIHTHISESRDEQEKCLAAHGVTPAEYYDRCGILTDRTTCAHGVYLSDDDLALLAKRGTSLAHNPASNMKLGNGFAPAANMLAHGVNVAIGTDGCCSNNNQSMLREMQLAALVHKGTAKEATSLPASKVFEMATKNGARALGLEGVVGEIRVGMKADLAMFSLDYPGFYPLGEPKAALCYASAGLRADTVIVNGKILLSEGKFTTIDAQEVRRHVDAVTDRLGAAY